MATDATADQLRDYLASDGAGSAWTYFADLGDWESLYNLHDERHFVGRLSRNPATRGLANSRRRLRLRLTPTGEALAGDRERKATAASAKIDQDVITGDADDATNLVRGPQAL